MPDEQLHWAAYASEVGGLCDIDVENRVRTSAIQRVGAAVVAVLLIPVAVILFLLAGPSGGEQRLPMAVATGRTRDGVAIQVGQLIGEHRGDGLLLALTTRRLLLLVRREGRLEGLATFARQQLAGVEVIDTRRRHRLRLRRNSFARLSFIDGSTLDLHLRTTDRAVFEHVVALSSGQAAVTAVVSGVEPTAEVTRSPGQVKDALWHLPADAAAELLKPKEALVLAVGPGRGHVVGRIGSEVREPHRPVREVSLPQFAHQGLVELAESNPAGPDIDAYWTDDPAVAYWFVAKHPDDDAVRLADVLAHAGMAARVLVTDQRVSVLVRLGPIRVFRRPKLQVAVEMDAARVTGVDHQLAGRSLPPQRIARLQFADGSQLYIRVGPHPKIPSLVRAYRRLRRRTNGNPHGASATP